MDLALTIYLLVFSAIVVFRLGRRFGQGHQTLGQLLLVCGIVTAVLLAWRGGSSLRWAVLVPHSSALLIANASVILIVGAAGILVGTQCLSIGREKVAAAGLCLTAIWFGCFSVIRPIWQPLHLSEKAVWRDGICLQSHEATCAPAAAATLLRLHGIHASERDMARACLTSSQGTLSLGTYRGLYVAAGKNRAKPQALVCLPDSFPAEMLDRNLPMLVHVDFESLLAPSRVRHAERFSAISSEGGHAVVILDRLADGSWLVADPATGKKKWSDDYFRSIWIGEGIYLASH